MGFLDQIRSWRRKTEDRGDLIYTDAVKQLVQAAGRTQESVQFTGGSFEVGKVPVLSGELAESQTVTNNGLIVASGIGAYSRVPLLQLKSSTAMHFSAPHARWVEYGTSKFRGRFFVRNAVQGWSGYVAEAVRKYPQ